MEFFIAQLHFTYSQFRMQPVMFLRLQVFESQAKTTGILHIRAQTTTDQDGLDDGLRIDRRNNKSVSTQKSET